MAGRSRSNHDRARLILPHGPAGQHQPASHQSVVEKVVVTYDGCFRRRWALGTTTTDLGLKLGEGRRPRERVLLTVEQSHVQKS